PRRRGWGSIVDETCLQISYAPDPNVRPHGLDVGLELEVRMVAERVPTARRQPDLNLVHVERSPRIGRESVDMRKLELRFALEASRQPHDPVDAAHPEAS